MAGPHRTRAFLAQETEKADRPNPPAVLSHGPSSRSLPRTQIRVCGRQTLAVTADLRESKGGVCRIVLTYHTDHVLFAIELSVASNPQFLQHAV